MKKIIQTTSCVLALGAITMLSGCSKGPSDGDAKAAVQAALGNCEYLSIGHFEKINGTPQGESHYLVDIKYSVKLTPTPDIKAYAADKYAAEVDALKQQLAHAHEVENAWKSDQQNWLQANPSSNSAAYEIAHQEGWAEYQKVMPLLLNGDQQLTNAPRSAKAAMGRAMQRTCNNTNKKIIQILFDGEKPVEQYGVEVEEFVTDKLMMVKTDNGWQEVQ